MKLFSDFASFCLRHERVLSPAVFLGGFIIDNLTLTRIDLWVSNAVLFSYLAIAGTSISLANYYEGRGAQSRFAARATVVLELAMQFALGGLFSGYFIYYTKSASLAVSWPFIAVLLFMLIGNELFKKRYQRLGFQVGAFFFALFSFMIFFVPVIVGKMGVLVFLVSGVLSIVGIAAFLALVALLAPQRIRGGRRTLILVIGGIYLALNVAYFTNIIPPIPLALKSSGVYQGVERTATGDYELSGEQHSFFDRLKFYEEVHLTPGERVYAYSAVFAPTKLSTSVVHRWQYYNEGKRQWVTSTEVSFPVAGGRDGGYRGFSYKDAVFPGKWRVEVMTPQGQVLGQVQFVVFYVDTPPVLITTVG
ncbi:MAG: hypothetical protein A2675_00765 [Candidatus Yonathbacteria bacterium RIFCSPHIGHO2_01_FULL_51_10]|uniref:DUF2914 domain-containing protein n=1 Tax=Candidatus Yonathbacteria bacterium RIFCSPHIGHO2_01_FULL_51_10 TaxID=1802723 RepID=A0A1G2S8T8_9BACT|nr:MAG: hypothetical protein A2675_00765 [Candidatus Yonathbacteria bacterium RIFCSPHIGHO2_01_FULL_51_10]